MYPVSVFGFVLVAATVMYLMRPERRFLPLVASLGAVTFVSGLLGACSGVVYSLHALGQVPQAEQVRIAALGISESLHDAMLAMMIVVFDGLVVAAASLRAARQVPTPTAG